MTYRYKVGQMLELRAAPRHSNRPAGPCEVVACLPHEKGPVLYRVKALDESYERVVDEIDVRPSSVTKTPKGAAEALFSIAVSKR
ncbi:hypothetical protein IC608_00835 [Devosia sp. PTR5]|jgi:hypothetical protein|uniref:Uncharacterized protein n=1 Tax=Devosia oryzisoli TaxID=2774138 RepID=A0A927IP02_9HYPH|nr:hypothetical protein [Devosia oryzisoli]MBD8064020.1 hypothetical protein [Devosia oryzisoli]